MNHCYPARIEKADDGFTITFRDMPEAISAAYEYEEALVKASEVLTFTLEALVADGSHVPRPSEPRQGEYLIVPSPVVRDDLLRLERKR